MYQDPKASLDEKVVWWKEQLKGTPYENMFIDFRADFKGCIHPYRHLVSKGPILVELTKEDWSIIPGPRRLYFFPAQIEADQLFQVKTNSLGTNFYKAFISDLPLVYEVREENDPPSKIVDIEELREKFILPASMQPGQTQRVPSASKKTSWVEQQERKEILRTHKQQEDISQKYLEERKEQHRRDTLIHDTLKMSISELKVSDLVSILTRHKDVAETEGIKLIVESMSKIQF